MTLQINPPGRPAGSGLRALPAPEADTATGLSLRVLSQAPGNPRSRRPLAFQVLTLTPVSAPASPSTSGSSPPWGFPYPPGPCPLPHPRWPLPSHLDQESQRPRAPAPHSCPGLCSPVPQRSPRAHHQQPRHERRQQAQGGLPRGRRTGGAHCVVLGVLHPLVRLHAGLTQGLGALHAVAGGRGVVLAAGAALGAKAESGRPPKAPSHTAGSLRGWGGWCLRRRR